MLTRRWRSRCLAASPAGLTLIEVLVVLLVVGVFLALILPGLVLSRHRAKRTMCMGNMRNVSTACHAYATVHNGDLPSLRGPLLDNDADPLNPLQSGWAVELLPFLEQGALYDHLTASRGSAGVGSPNTLQQLSSVSIKVYTCADSPQAGRNGALSFVANTGYMTADVWDDPAHWRRHQVSGTYDWNNGPYDADSAEDARVSLATGVFLFDPTGRQAMSLNWLSTGDGQSHTLMLSENLDAGPWIGGSPHEVGFAVRIHGTGRQIPDSTVRHRGLGGGTMETALEFSSDGGGPLLDLGPSAINSDLYETQRPTPRPSSVHLGAVNVMFGDGHGRSISERIDSTVYARLVSSRGQQCAQPVLSASDF
jgi:prepilin-type N-terminal cleavage/methylation domain-containing protein/prepilin-type processing-associated H-X9-DG protein